MAMQFVREVTFKNWTKTDFTFKYASDDYTFEAGGTYNVPADVAAHFAKHLAIRELHLKAEEAKKPFTSIEDKTRASAVYEALPDNLMKEYQENCFPIKSKVSGGTNSFERTDVKDVASKEAKPESENKTVKDVQNETTENDDADASDDKNNAGAPIIKGLDKKGTKDSKYTR